MVKAILLIFVCLLLVLPSYELFSQPYAYVTTGATNKIAVIDVSIDWLDPDREITVPGCTYDGIDTPVNVLRSETPEHGLFTSVDRFGPLYLLGFTGEGGGRDPRGLTDIILDHSGTKLYVICSGTVYYGYAYGNSFIDVNQPVMRGEPELGTVFVVDIASKSVLAEIEVGDDPQALALSPDGSTLYVANGKIPIDFSGFDGDGNPTDPNIPTDNDEDMNGMPDNGFNYLRIPTMSPIGDVGVAQGREEDIGNSISLINTATNRVRTTVDLSGVDGSNPRELVVSPDGNWLFIGNYDYNPFRDPRDMQSPNRFVHDRRTNLGLDFLSSYRGEFNTSSITVLDLRTGAFDPIQTIPLEGLDIHDMAIHPEGHQLHIISEYTRYSINEMGGGDGMSPVLVTDEGKQYGGTDMRRTDLYQVYSVESSPTDSNVLTVDDSLTERLPYISDERLDWLNQVYEPDFNDDELDSLSFQTTWGLAFAPDGTLYKWGMLYNALMYVAPIRGIAYVTHHHAANIAISPDGEKLLITRQGFSRGVDPLVEVYDITTGELIDDNALITSILIDVPLTTNHIFRRLARDVNIVMGLGVETDCGDELDNDFDGRINCDDVDCSNDDLCTPIEICTDGLDNDFDGRIDCKDGDCATHLRCQPEICDDELDNDGDDLIDCDDSDCDNDSVCDSAPPEDDCPDEERRESVGGRTTEDHECPPSLTPSNRNTGGCGCTLVATTETATANLLIPMIVFVLAFGLRRIRKRK